MNSSEKAKLTADTITGALATGTVAGAGGILSGVALTTVTTTSWVVFTTTATVVAPWAVAGCFAVGALSGGLASAWMSKREIDRVNEHFKKFQK